MKVCDTHVHIDIKFKKMASKSTRQFFFLSHSVMTMLVMMRKWKKMMKVCVIVEDSSLCVYLLVFLCVSLSSLTLFADGSRKNKYGDGK